MLKANCLFLSLTALAITGASSMGCSSAGDDGASSEAAATASSERFGPRLFRDDFYTYLKSARKADGSAYSDEDIQKLVYLPTEAVLRPAIPESASGEQRLAAYDKEFSRIKPSDLYNAGVAAPFAAQEDLEKVLREEPIHIVVVPGIFGEFIPRTPFEEVFAADSVARSEWKAKGALGKDERYNVKTLTNDSRPLSELIRVGSIDGKGPDGANKALVTVAYLRAGIGSLEDFGTLEENNAVYLRRLDAYFAALGGVPKNLYIMGYSRGTATGLDLVVRAHRANKPWARNIKGFLAHAGVIYGSQLADASFSTGPGTDTLKLLGEFVGTKDAEGSLESCPGATVEERASGEASLALHAKNTLVNYPKFLASFSLLTLKGIDLRNPSHSHELKVEGINTSLPDAARFSAFAGRVLGLRLPFTTVEMSELEGVVNLESGRTLYCRNVESFKITARKIIAGAETLTTKARVDWWKRPENALPPGVRYFAITGTMGDAQANDAPWELTTNPVAYDPASVDFRSLRGNYYDLLAASGGNQLQDSQVPVQRGRFWPELHTGSTAFAASTSRLRTYFMGTVGVHHWGLAFPRAFSSKDGLDANPFPRTALLESIATFVAQVEKGDR